ncbi:uncharacterized protein B0T23DRAFT_41533 [Neurospora hispaniola]|uniref:Uncharacterized protein n=1 Tax=Neurospora hispaniola TaxID=588809 RepID=A0AAJ0MW49_9PEZI|nr:hypothetical protein B0T23DRAFT_41533 [Neurospora hispaniola]
MGTGLRQTDLRSKAVSPDRWIDPGLLFRRDSESSVSSSYHSTPTNGSSQIRATILESMNLPLTPYPDSNTASSLLSPLPEVPDTPSSTLGQFGDIPKNRNPSAAELVQKVHKSWRSQSREGHGRTQESHSRTRSGRHHSQSRSRSEQRNGRDIQESREALESRQRSLSRSTAKASIDDRDTSLSRGSNHASTKDRQREREMERERERDTDRSQTSSHRRAASSKELRLLAHERSYDNDREIAATKVSMYLQSLAAQTPQPMPSPPQSNASQTPQPQSSHTPKLQSSQTPKPAAPPVQQIPARAAADTPIPSMSAMSFTSEADKELLQENRGLYQRVAALQRTERDLLAENQELVRQLAMFKKHHETRHQQWKDEYQKIKEREKILQVEAQQLKARIMRQEEQILDLAVANAQFENPAPSLSDKQITSWFAERDASWFLWAQHFASQDPNRLSSGLHPLQLHEVCHGIKSFVKLTDDSKLPAELLVKGTDMIQAVLHGMLVNFICTETLSSPFWIFNAISAGSPESPFVAPATAISPGGFRLDLAMQNAIPPRTYAPAPTLAPNRDPRFPPPLITTNLQPGGLLSASSLAYPMKDEMENMFHMLTKAQTGESGITSVQLREAQLVQLFADSGMSIKNPQDAGGVEAKRMLVESRLNYARRLKERFLSGPARFLLHDQDPAGIANLERTLTEYIDDALIFSCQLWSRPGPIRFHGFTALGGKLFKPSDRLMSLCHAQSPQAPNAIPAHLGQVGSETPGPPGYYDGRPVVMVVQPAIETIEVGGGREDDPNKPRKIAKVWLKARVLVATSSQEQQVSKTQIITNVTVTPPSEPQAKTPPEMAERTLLIGPVPRSAVRSSPKRVPDGQQGQFPTQVASYYTASLGHPMDSHSAPLEKVGIAPQQETGLMTS